jgi:ribosomal protein L4
LGNLRAPGRKKGVKAHGAKPKIYTYHLNEKIKLKALKSLLSSKLA